MNDEDKCCDVCGQWHQSHDDLICTLYSYLEQKDARIKELEAEVEYQKNSATNFCKQSQAKNEIIDQLKEREKKLIECVRYYACGIKTHIADASYPYCSDYDVSNNLFWYGKLARQVLKELGIQQEIG